MPYTPPPKPPTPVPVAAKEKAEPKGGKKGGKEKEKEKEPEKSIVEPIFVVCSCYCFELCTYSTLIIQIHVHVFHKWLKTVKNDMIFI